jgi:hypothetical protein
MQTRRIRALIEEGRTIERQTGILGQAVINLANANGRSVTELEVQKVTNFVSEYIEHAPALMKRIEEAAASSGAQHDVQPILDATENYFLTRLNRANHCCLSEAREDNAFVRRLIGEPFASILDDRVSATLGSPGMQQNIKQMLMALGKMNLFSGPDPVWGNARGSEIADARFGVMGVI